MLKLKLVCLQGLFSCRLIDQLFRDRGILPRRAEALYMSSYFLAFILTLTVVYINGGYKDSKL